ncbi:MAG: Cpe/LpqF family protein [Thermomicrobiales bacterium]
MPLTTRMTRRSAAFGFAALATGGAFVRFVGAQSPEVLPEGDLATPKASPIALPQGPLGEQLQWMEDSLNAEGGVTPEEVASHLAPTYTDLTAEEIADVITSLGAEGGPYEIDTSTLIMTMDFPPTLASFKVYGESGGILSGGMTIDRDSGLIGGFELISGTAATPTL